MTAAALLSAGQRQVVERARGVADEHLRPAAAAIDAGGEFPRTAYQAVVDAGLVGIATPPDDEEVPDPALRWAMAIEELAAGSAAVADVCLLTEMLIALLTEVGSAEQGELVGPLRRGASLGAFALTEEQAGSDAGAVATTARRVEGGYRLTGRKAYINNATVADWALVLATTDPGAGTDAITAFLVPGDQLTRGPAYDLTGQRGIAVGELGLDDVLVPDDAVVGAPGAGFTLAMQVLDLGRTGVAALAVGIARAALDDAIGHITQREQFGRPLAAFQGLRWKVADLATELDAARELTHRAARLRDAGAPCRTEAAMAKIKASDVAMQVTVDALQLHGGRGCHRGAPLDRYMRDAKITQIYEGANEVLRQVVARGVLG